MSLVGTRPPTVDEWDKYELQWYGVELTEENKKQFYISEGFAHGFLVLSDTAEFCYKCTDLTTFFIMLITIAMSKIQ